MIERERKSWLLIPLTVQTMHDFRLQKKIKLIILDYK
jgi:hypothetical protein